MCSSDVNFNLKPYNGSSKKFWLTVSIPINYGFIENVYFVNNNEKFKLNHLKNDDNYVYFKGIIEIISFSDFKGMISCMINNKYCCFDMDNKKMNNEVKNLEKAYETPSWTKGKIMYHIFVDRFNRGNLDLLKPLPRRHIHDSWDEPVWLGPDENGIWNNDFFGGDLQGIIDKLDYLKSLGVSILYLSPLVFSQSNHRYDTADYETVDPYLGNNDNLKQLCNEAHKRNMKVIVDAVFNHTGNDSKYFNEYHTFPNIGAYESSDSPYLDFYRYYNENGKIKFNYWWGMKNLPVCNGDSIKWQEYITGIGGIIDQWFALGIDGLRLDVADELTDNFIELIKKAVKRNKKDGFVLGEVWKNPMRMNRDYVGNDKMDSVMNYNFISAMIKFFRDGDVNFLREKIDEVKNEYSIDMLSSIMNFTSTHDMTRAINLWDKNIFHNYNEWPWDLINNNLDFCKNYHLTDEQYNKAKDIYMAYIFSLIFMPGTLSIFYGDEVGVQGIGNLKNRSPFPWNNIDKELLDFFKYMGLIRKNEPFMEQAKFNIIDININTLLFERIKDEQKIFVIVNRTPNETSFTIPQEYQNPQKVYTLKKMTNGNLAGYGGIAIKK